MVAFGAPAPFVRSLARCIARCRHSLTSRQQLGKPKPKPLTEEELAKKAAEDERKKKVRSAALHCHGIVFLGWAKMWRMLMMMFDVHDTQLSLYLSPYGCHSIDWMLLSFAYPCCLFITSPQTTLLRYAHILIIIHHDI